LAVAVLSLTVAASLAAAQDAQTLKERLSDKASDEQRMDNCRVPLERRGTTPRPDCSAASRSSAPAAIVGGHAPNAR
jgi:hypothetical protein